MCTESLAAGEVSRRSVLQQLESQRKSIQRTASHSEERILDFREAVFCLNLYGVTSVAFFCGKELAQDHSVWSHMRAHVPRKKWFADST